MFKIGDKVIRVRMPDETDSGHDKKHAYYVAQVIETRYPGGGGDYITCQYLYPLGLKSGERLINKDPDWRVSNRSGAYVLWSEALEVVYRLLNAGT